MKIAITGASGKTGYRITEEAMKKGIKVKQIVRKNSKIPENLKNTETFRTVSYTHLRAHETGRNLVCRLLLEKNW